VQTWIKEGTLDELAIQYLNTSLDEVCEQFTDIVYERTLSFTAACVDNFTSISLYIYVGDEFNITECNACKAPIEGSDDYETYVLELPCVSDCIPESPTASPSTPEPSPSASPSIHEPNPSASPSSFMPTVCVPKPDLISGSLETITETTIQITGPKTDTVDFDVVQTWITEGNLDVFAILYLSISLDEVCEQFPDIAYEEITSFTAACVDNITSVSLYIYVGDEFNIEECDACKAPLDSSNDYEAYVFELPCVTECPPESPTASPSIPEPEPTVSPSTAMPTCVPQPELISTTGSPEDITETTVHITGPHIETIDFDIVQTWIEGNLDEFAIRYLNTDFIEVCEQFTDVAYEQNKSFTAACVDNFTSISLYIYVGEEFNIDECNACTAPIDGSDEYEAYVLELPCVPECVPTAPIAISAETIAPTVGPTVAPTDSPTNAPTDAPTTQETMSVGGPISVLPEVVPEEALPADECFTGAKIQSQEKDMWCERDATVISMEEQATDGAFVQFTVKNVYDQEANVEILYNRGAGEAECQNLLVLASGESYDGILTATCNAITQTATVEIFVDNNSKSHGATSGQKCKDLGRNTCHIVYQVPCLVEQMCDGTRRKLASTFEQPSTTLDGSLLLGDEIKTSVPVVESNENEDDDAPYCVNKEFPCVGDEEKMVYVCHYSNRGGYQTFCIPEADSDVMRFYFNDYCGPCEGWNGVSQAGQF
jgi:hypothetical protein